MGERLLEGNTLGSYMWGREHCSMLLPSELIYTGRSVGVCITNIDARTSEDV